ncbi:IclR family transcriptional regulator [Leucobacter soli]|uniref:Transcriptional repressor IclR n=1 Tax=Leucobacter soli TaxID=2812850 RepID=A0A916K268_9MICO|nr:IclR family transcriptional regulator [Leucobacter soli]CAG7619339.1 Transcriptional repressor IclR [Leucobacter soli]
MTISEVSSQKPGTGTIERTLRALAVVAEIGPEGSGLTAIAERLSLPAPTVHRLLRILSQEDFVVLDEVRHLYRPGAEFYRVAARVLAGFDESRLVLPTLEKLAARFNETVVFGRFHPVEGALSFVARADGSQLLQYRIEMNRADPVIWGASGKAVLAQLDDEVIEQLLEDVSHRRGAMSERALPELSELQEQVRRIRADGFAVSEGEKLPDARGIGVPVFDARGVVGSITLTSPRSRLPHSEVSVIGAALIEASKELSTKLGATPSE